MSKLQGVAFIGNHLPRRCGIATFTHDLHGAPEFGNLRHCDDGSRFHL
jgi:hypothetical protein